MVSKVYTFRAGENEVKEIEGLKKEGIGITDIFRAGLNQYLNKPLIKTKAEAEKVVERVQAQAPTEKQGQFNIYGCGCAKEQGKVFCPKHKRM